MEASVLCFLEPGYDTLLHPSWAPFHGIVPGVAVTPIGEITLLVTFETLENFCMETMQFEITDFETAYNAFLGRSALFKFMAIPHYTYLALKMPGSHGIIYIRRDIKWAYNCDRESCEMVDRLLASAELQELKQALAESHPDLVKLEAKTSKTSIQPEDALSKTVSLSTEDPSKVAHVGHSLVSK
jgi:hypothetical protein